MREFLANLCQIGIISYKLKPWLAGIISITNKFREWAFHEADGTGYVSPLFCSLKYRQSKDLSQLSHRIYGFKSTTRNASSLSLIGKGAGG